MEEERRLRALDETVGAWLDFALQPRGIARHRALRDLFRLSQQMTESLFVRSVARALKYRIRSVETVRRIAFMVLSEGEATLPTAEVDEGLLERDAYQEGRLTDEPSFAAWHEVSQEDEHEGENDADHG